jgi:hypothetical protein
MAEIIEVLNNTSGVRTFFYVVSLIVLIAVLLDGIAIIIESIKK